MSDYRIWCRKFLSAECPNNCHYANGCKHQEGLIEMVLAEKKVCKGCGGSIYSNKNKCRSCREKEILGIQVITSEGYKEMKNEFGLPDFIFCPNCNSASIATFAGTFAYVKIDVNTGIALDVIECDYPDKIEEFHCDCCHHNWKNG